MNILHRITLVFGLFCFANLSFLAERGAVDQILDATHSEGGLVVVVAEAACHLSGQEIHHVLSRSGVAVLAPATAGE